MVGESKTGKAGTFTVKSLFQQEIIVTICTVCRVYASYVHTTDISAPIIKKCSTKTVCTFSYSLQTIQYWVMLIAYEFTIQRTRHSIWSKCVCVCMCACEVSKLDGCCQMWRLTPASHFQRSYTAGYCCLFSLQPNKSISS